MNIKNYMRYGVLFIGIALLSACYKDNNNYLIDEVNEVHIKTDEESYAVEQLSELIVTPSLGYTQNEEDSYSYEWRVFTPRTREVGAERKVYEEVIATTRDLKANVYAPAGRYVLLYTVTNNRTGVKNFKELQLTVNSGFYEGLIVAYDKGNSAELGFIRADGKVGHDLIHHVNNMVLPDNAVSIHSIMAGSIKLISFTTSNNMYHIDPDEFKIVNDKNALFNNTIPRFGNSYFGANKLEYFDVPTDIFYINEGKLYADMGPDWTGFMAGMYSFPFYYSHGDYNLFPFLFNAEMGAEIIFYDNLNKKFVRSAYTGRELGDVIQSPTDNFDPSNVNKTAVAAMLGYGGNVYYIMKDDGGKYYVYTMTQYASAIAQGIAEVNLALSPDFQKAKVFDARTDKREIYYAVDNKLYVYQLSTNSAKVVLTLNADEQIADIKVYRANMWQSTADSDFNKRIYVAANTGDEGKIYQYGLSADGSLSKTPEKEFLGFGKIVDINYRTPNE